MFSVKLVLCCFGDSWVESYVYTGNVYPFKNPPIFFSWPGSVFIKQTSCWSKIRSMSRALMCCFFPRSCKSKKAKYWNHLVNDSLKQTTSKFVYFSNSPCFPWTSWREWSFSSVSQTPSSECLGKTWGHWWSAVRQTDKGCCETFAGLLQDKLTTFHIKNKKRRIP